MIYIIDNGEGVPDQEIYLLEITDEEAELFGEALWPLIKEGWTNDFIIGSTAYVNWFGDSKSEKLSNKIHLRSLFLQQSTYGILRRRRDVPTLAGPMIDKIFEWHGTAKEPFAFYIGHNLCHFNWDEVRRVLSEES